MGDRWRREGGYREVLKIASPLILSMGSWSIMHFVDRMFLTWYNREALAAALPAGVLNFAIGALFLGTAGYVNTFVAQYEGAERPERVGSAVWQGSISPYSPDWPCCCVYRLHLQYSTGRATRRRSRCSRSPTFESSALWWARP